VSDTSFVDRLQSHVGGLVRVADHPVAFLSLPWFNGKVGLLLSARPLSRRGLGAGVALAAIDIFVDGSVHSCEVKPKFLDLVGAEDGSI
jgi:hypothetical protein